MNNKELILKRLAADGMPEYPYPEPRVAPQRFDDPAATFAERLAAAGGRAVELRPGETLDEAVRRCYPEARTIASALPGICMATIDPDRVEDPRELVDVDLGVVAGSFGVAENGAVWIAQISATRRSTSERRPCSSSFPARRSSTRCTRP